MGKTKVQVAILGGETRRRGGKVGKKKFSLKDSQ